jgi:pilus assembly protein CpaF
MAFSIIISEKGGAERRESFDKNEISVGRVQGNDLMLPKGNVSKRHARLIFRDGRFIVTDLKSTNGTYVNGRKIGQATVVREGDKIYVGDFVLRFVADPNTRLSPDSQPSASQREEVQSHEPPPLHAQGAPQAAPVIQGGPHGQVGGNSGVPPGSYSYAGELDQETVSGQKGPAAPQHGSLPPRAMPGAVPPPRISAMPSPSGAPPRPTSTHPAGDLIPGAPRPLTKTAAMVGGGINITSTAPSAGVAAPTGLQNQVGNMPSGAPPARSYEGAPSRPPSRGRIPARPAIEPENINPDIQSMGQDGAPDGFGGQTLGGVEITPQQSAMLTLIDRIGEMIDLSSMDAGTAPDDALGQRLQRAIQEQVTVLKRDGEIAADVDSNQMMQAAHRDLFDLGALGPLLDDPEVSEIRVLRYDHLEADRNGTQLTISPAFGGSRSLKRIFGRMVHRVTGSPLPNEQQVVDLTWGKGNSLTAVVSPDGPIFKIRKQVSVDSSLESLVRSGTMSRSIAMFLHECVMHQINVLVVGVSGGGLDHTLCALTQIPGAVGHTSFIHDSETTVTPQNSRRIRLPSSSEEQTQLLQAIGKLRPKRLVMVPLAGTGAASLLEFMGNIPGSVIAGVRASSIRVGLARLVPDLCRAYQGLMPEPAREWVTSSFDICIEVSVMRDGRSRVTRVSELAGSERGTFSIHDIFAFSADNSQTSAGGGGFSGTFYPTGRVPRIVDELRARGSNLDTSIFERSSSR